MALFRYVSLVIDDYKFAKKEKVHRVFYNTLGDIKDNHCMSQEVRNIAQNLINSRKADVEKLNNLWRKASKARKTSSLVTSPLLSSSSSVLGKRQRDPTSTNSSSKKQCVESGFCLNVDVPLHADESVDILEIVKSSVRIFDQNNHPWFFPFLSPIPKV
ncbi:hypothetical protein F8M41_000926 [Gigaspora margarita]|uniref:Uncharacterized protein n=1 Tax=Gigaspora margarita TaxID=4874 RepID=A0A8H3XF85_GIGMA|nr:hypothetical protein F8M41_000926 [Gigaspora margarita]